MTFQYPPCRLDFLRVLLAYCKVSSSPTVYHSRNLRNAGTDVPDCRSPRPWVENTNIAGRISDLIYIPLLQSRRSFSWGLSTCLAVQTSESNQVKIRHSGSRTNGRLSIREINPWTPKSGVHLSLAIVLHSRFTSCLFQYFYFHAHVFSIRASSPSHLHSYGTAPPMRSEIIPNISLQESIHIPTIPTTTQKIIHPVVLPTH